MVMGDGTFIMGYRNYFIHSKCCRWFKYVLINLQLLALNVFMDMQHQIDKTYGSWSFFVVFSL